MLSVLLSATVNGVIVAFACLGCGAWVWRMLDDEPARFTESILVGLAPIAGAGILLNFFFAITPGIRAGFLILAVLAGIVEFFRSKIRPVEIGAFSICLLYFVKESLLTPMPYDTAFYHLQAVRWMEVSRLFPGIALVHTRLGFDSLSLIASAMLAISNTWSAPMLLGCVITAAVEAQFLSYMLTAPRNERLASISYAAVCAFLLLFARGFFDLGSLSTDVAPGVLILFMVFWLIRLFEGASPPRYLALIPVVAVTAKLSAAVIAVGGAWLYFRLKSFRRRAVLLAATLGALWVGRNVVLSGYLVYPVCITDLHTSWGLSRDQCATDMMWIKSWARIPTHDTEETKDVGWVYPWLQASSAKLINRLAAILAIAGALMLTMNRKRERWFWQVAALLSAAILFWFAAAPDIRFGAGLVIAFAGLVFGAGLPLPRVPGWVAWLVCGYLLLSVALDIRQVPATWPQVRRAQTSVTMVHGVAIRFPKEGRLCWAEDPPCAARSPIELPPAQALRLGKAMEFLGHSQK